jgi:hypothetical protein
VISELFEVMEEKKDEADILFQPLLSPLPFMLSLFLASSSVYVIVSLTGLVSITDWGISQTSLEDVFLTIVRNDEGGIGFTS